MILLERVGYDKIYTTVFGTKIKTGSGGLFTKDRKELSYRYVVLLAAPTVYATFISIKYSKIGVNGFSRGCTFTMTD